MKTMIGACGAAALLALAVATPAAAQQAGTYTGTSADGNSLSFTVGTDSSTGSLAVTGTNISFTAPCRNDTYVLNSDWGTGLLDDITNRRVKISASGNYFTFNVSLVFSADGQSATGTIQTFAPTLSPVGPHPTKALYCTSPKQALTVTLNAVSGAAQSASKAINQHAGKILSVPDNSDDVTE